MYITIASSGQPHSPPSAYSPFSVLAAEAVLSAGITRGRLPHHLRIVVLEVIVPGPVERFEGLLHWVGAVAVADFLHDPELFKFGERVVDLEIDLDPSPALEVDFDVVVQLGAGPAVFAAAAPEEVISQDRLAAFLLLGLVEEPEEDA